MFAGHRITGVAGRGGMGVVYRAVQLDLDRAVALKLIAADLAEDSSFRDRFVRESRLAASIDHPNVIPIYYTGEFEGDLYIAMRYVDGSDLRTLVRALGRLEPERAVHIVAQVASALDAAHERGIVHRDVKPANVLLGASDHAYLTDFGLTKRISSHSGNTRAGGWVGTLGFVAPEQIRGERVDARADVYALGCVLFHTLAGGPPYQRDSDEATLWAHLHDDPPSLRANAPDAPPELQAVIDRALAKEPDDRYQSAGDLGRAALAAIGRHEGAARRARRRARRGGARGGRDRGVARPGADRPRRSRPAPRRPPTGLGLGARGGSGPRARRRRGHRPARRRRGRHPGVLEHGDDDRDDDARGRPGPRGRRPRRADDQGRQPPERGRRRGRARVGAARPQRPARHAAPVRRAARRTARGSARCPRRPRRSRGGFGSASSATRPSSRSASRATR